MTDPTIEPAMTIREICIATGKSKSSVYEMLKAGDIPCHRGKGGCVVPRQWFRRYLAGEWTKPVAAPTALRQPSDLIRKIG